MLQKRLHLGRRRRGLRERRPRRAARRFRWNRLGANPLETFGVISQWDLVEGSAHLPRQLPGAGPHGDGARHGLQPAAQQGALHQPSARRQLRRQGRGARHRHHRAAVAEGGRPSGQVDRGPHGVPRRRREPGLGPPLRRGDRARRRTARSPASRCGCSTTSAATAEGWGAVSAAKPLTNFTGCYAIPAAQYDLTIVATNKLPGSPYRGMGPPPHNWVLEQLMDLAARKLALDPAEIRRRNYIPRDAFPYTIASGNEYDSGDYAAALETALEMGDYPRAPRRAAGGARRGPLPRHRPRQHDRARRLRLERLRDRRPARHRRARGRDGRRSISSASSRSRSASRSKGRASTPSRRRCSPTTSRVDIADVRVVALDIALGAAALRSGRQPSRGRASPAPCSGPPSV